MKQIYLFIALFFCINFSEIKAQTFSVGHTTITFNDPSRTGGFGSGGGTGRQIQTEIYYPANTNGNNVAVANGSFPIVVFGHGFAMSWDAYQNIWEDLASKGYVIAFPRTEGSLIPAPSHNNFGLDLAIVEVKMQALNNNSGSIFYQKILSKSAIMGHSMGGGAAFLGSANNNSATLKTVIGLAPAETNPSAVTAALSVNLDALVLSGSSDGVTPPSSNHLPIYQNLNSNCKTFVSITNGSHCYFANSNFNCDFGELTTGTGSLPRAQQQDISSDYMLMWLAYKLKGDCAAFNNFEDSLSISPRITSMQLCNVTPVALVQIDTTLCFGEVFNLNGASLSNSGVYFDTIFNTAGCDSLQYTLNLTINNLDSTFNQSFSCNPSDTGWFQSTFQNQYFCDSIYLSQVNLAPFAQNSVNIVACDSALVLGNYFFQSTVLYDTITGGSLNGCDSITVFNITVNNSSEQTIDTSFCQGASYLLPNGNLTDTAGIFTFNLTATDGCDSAVILNLNVIDIAMISDSDFSYNFISDDTFIVYFNPSFAFDSIVWQDGVNFFVESFGDSAIYYTGNIVDDSGIAAEVYTSNCAQFYYYSMGTGIRNRLNSTFKVYPNPSKNLIQLSADSEFTYVEIINNLGQVVYKNSLTEKSHFLDINSLRMGVYLIKTNFGTEKLVIVY